MINYHAKSFVYSDVSSDSDLNQLMFIIRNGGLFVVNHDTHQCKQAWRKITEKEVKRVEVGQIIWPMIGHEQNKQWFYNKRNFVALNILVVAFSFVFFFPRVDVIKHFWRNLDFPQIKILKKVCSDVWSCNIKQHYTLTLLIAFKMAYFC